MQFCRGETHVESLGEGEGGDVTSSLLSIDVDTPELPGNFRMHCKLPKSIKNRTKLIREPIIRKQD